MAETRVVPLRWIGEIENGCLEMLDQRLLPHREHWHRMESAEEVARGIREMIIRGAPAIGIAAAFGVALGMRDFFAGKYPGDRAETSAYLNDLLAKTRPTAVNLFWALERCQILLADVHGYPDEVLVKVLFELADDIFNEDRENNLKMGQFGAELLPEKAKILTHCNTGGLATGGYGTALGIIRACHARGRLDHVWIDETRPYLQGSRLTAWECLQDGIPATLITDSMAAHFMKEGEVDAVIVGTDRVVANGDMANKIGSYGLAVLCKYHGIPFYVAAPWSTIDLETADGPMIPIEQRSAREVTHVGDHMIAPTGIDVAHPAFDVTPSELITAIITERGVLQAPYHETLQRF